MGVCSIKIQYPKASFQLLDDVYISINMNDAEFESYDIRRQDTTQASALAN